ncbi:hypothetical protein BZG36_03682 [Bifiguratus adelaidae]|uniref:Uncharacterized protein n=1 Tax=Bifiguratus adelaidae TaxID=1938954 RepID=A0A261XZV3_9FUNG|nr:hypothetical protein BZG36_03682 [Bifiguratus adelaidae]
MSEPSFPDNARSQKPKTLAHEINPYKHKRYPLFRVRGSIIDDILGRVCVAILWAVLITLLDRVGKYNMGMPTTLITVLSMVVSLMLVFRTNTAYDRFWEGRRLWGQMVTALRSCSRIIWINGKDGSSSDVLEKKSAINLLIAFAIATKNYLRQEYGPEHPELWPWIQHIPKYSFPTITPQYEDISQQPGGSKLDRLPFRNLFRRKYADNDKGSSKNQFESYIHHQGNVNIPLEITLYLSSYATHQRAKDNLDVPNTTALLNNITSLTDCLTGFERILRTPIPAAYSIHLSQTVWLYILMLPTQLVGAGYGYYTILLVAIAAFTLLGIEAIGKEIENPFGYDPNDLPLDNFCEALRKELENMTSLPPPKLEDWVFSPLNHPMLATGHSENAQELRRKSIEEVRSLLSTTSETKHRTPQPSPIQTEFGILEEVNIDGEKGSSHRTYLETPTQQLPSPRGSPTPPKRSPGLSPVKIDFKEQPDPHKHKSGKRKHDDDRHHKSKRHRSHSSSYYTPPVLDDDWNPPPLEAFKSDEAEWNEKLFDAMAEDESDFLPEYWRSRSEPGRSGIDALTDEEYRRYMVEGMYERKHKDEIEAERRRQERKEAKKRQREADREAYRKAEEKRLRQARSVDAEMTQKKVAALRSKYEKRWEEVEALCEAKDIQSYLRHADIPWPIHTTSLLDAADQTIIKADMTEFLIGHLGQRAEQKAAIRKEQLRFHPDKFIQRYGKLFGQTFPTSEEHNHIIRTVNNVSSILNDVWKDLKV